MLCQFIDASLNIRSPCKMSPGRILTQFIIGPDIVFQRFNPRQYGKRIPFFPQPGRNSKSGPVSDTVSCMKFQECNCFIHPAESGQHMPEIFPCMKRKAQALPFISVSNRFHQTVPGAFICPHKDPDRSGVLQTGRINSHKIPVQPWYLIPKLLHTPDLPFIFVFQNAELHLLPMFQSIQITFIRNRLIRLFDQVADQPRLRKIPVDPVSLSCLFAVIFLNDTAVGFQKRPHLFAEFCFALIDRCPEFDFLQISVLELLAHRQFPVHGPSFC